MATSEQYLSLLQNLLPPGRAWTRDAGADLTKLLAALADELARDHNRADALVAEADPRTTLELLGDWERVAGLPDPCANITESIQERRAALVARLTLRGGQSVGYFLSIADALGYAGVTIEEFTPFRCGISQCGIDELGDESIWFQWVVNVPGPRVIKFQCGLSQCGIDTLTNINRAEDLECQIFRYAPAHSVPVFSYEGA